MKERAYKRVVLGFIMIHLVFVSMGASYIKIADSIAGKNIIDFYQKASGASSSYGFFAPAVGGKSRALFDITDNNGKKIENLSLMREPGREVELRLSGIYDEFSGKLAKEDKFRQSLAASLAANVFRTHPEAIEVTVHVQGFWPKSMAQYREGQRAAWADYYLARFAKNTNEAQQ